MDEPQYLVGEKFLSLVRDDPEAWEDRNRICTMAQATLDAGPVQPALWTKEQIRLSQHYAEEMCEKLGIPITSNSTELDMSDEAMREKFESHIAQKYKAFRAPHARWIESGEYSHFAIENEWQLWTTCWQYLREQMKGKV